MFNFIGQNLQQIPPPQHPQTQPKHSSSSRAQSSKNPNIITSIDASSNRLTKGISFKPYQLLVTLIVDDNQLRSLRDFPIFLHLETFSANKNNFSELGDFLDNAYDKFGELKNLSLLKNPFNPFFEGEGKYSGFRYEILDRFPYLKTLDGIAVVIMHKELAEKEKNQQEKYELIEAVMEYDQKYASDTVKTVKTRSEGNRFIKNNQL